MVCVSLGFAAALVLFGLALVGLSGVSGWLRRGPVAVSTVGVVVGLALGYGGVLVPDPRRELVRRLVELTLLLVLFTDGLVVERDLFVSHWRAPARALLLTMPVTLVILGVVARVVFPQLSWVQAFLLGSVLSPTDPVVSSTIVTSEDVPAPVRHTLNLESGLNDSIANPYVVLFVFLAAGHHGAVSVVEKALALAGQSAYGAVLGVVVALVAGWALDRVPPGGLAGEERAVAAAGLAVATYGIAEVSSGNGFLAVFTAAITLAVSSRQLPERFDQLTRGLSEALQVVVYLVIGALAAILGSGVAWWRVAVFVAAALVVARPAAISLSFIGLGMPRRDRLFIAWFGPKAVASLLYALMVIATGTPHRLLIVQVTVFTVLASVLVHSMTQRLGTRWLAAGVSGSGGQAGG